MVNPSSQLAERLLFLPGASGNTAFWRPVAARLRHPAAHSFMSWPGFGGVPGDPNVHGIDDLVARVLREMQGPVDLLAQSMGGVIGLRAVLERPGAVRHLVLAATSGGIDVAALGGSDWRASFRAANPGLPLWFEEERSDLSALIREVRVPVLLLWGDADPISPVAVGQRLAELFPKASLHVFQGGSHDLVEERAAEIAPLIDAHLGR